jgi:hypothetical protein
VLSDAAVVVSDGLLVLFQPASLLHRSETVTRPLIRRFRCVATHDQPTLQTVLHFRTGWKYLKSGGA